MITSELVLENYVVIKFSRDCYFHFFVVFAYIHGKSRRIGVHILIQIYIN